MRLKRSTQFLLLWTVLIPSCSLRHVRTANLGTTCATAGGRLSALSQELNAAIHSPGGCRDENGPRCDALRSQIGRLLVDCPSNTDVVMANAVLAFDSHNFVRAQQLLDELFSFGMANPEAAALRIRVALEQGNLPFALRFADQQIRRMGDDAGLRETYGSVLYLAGRLDESSTQLLIAKRLGASTWRIAYGLALIEEAQGHFDSAKLHYHEALQDKPGWNRAESRLRALLATEKVSVATIKSTDDVAVVPRVLTRPLNEDKIETEAKVYSQESVESVGNSVGDTAGVPAPSKPLPRTNPERVSAPSTCAPAPAAELRAASLDLNATPWPAQQTRSEIHEADSGSRDFSLALSDLDGLTFPSQSWRQFEVNTALAFVVTVLALIDARRRLRGPVSRNWSAQRGEPVSVSEAGWKPSPKIDWSRLLARNASGIPGGFHSQSVLQRLVVKEQSVTGVVVAIGVHGENAARAAVCEQVADVIHKVIGSTDFACQLGEGEFAVVLRGEAGAAAQRRLREIAEQLWNLQIRLVGDVPMVLSWGTVECRDERIGHVIEEATNRMQEIQRSRARFLRPDHFDRPKIATACA